MAGFAGRVGGVFRKFGSILAGVGGVMMRVGGVAFGMLKTGAVAVGGAIAGAAYAARSMLLEMDELAKVSRAIDFPIEAMQEFQFAAEQSGVDMNLFRGALLKFTKNVGEAKGGYGSLATGLKRSNPQLLKQLKSTTNMADALDLYLAAIKEVPDASKKAALATAGFGRTGISMTNLANESGERLQALREQMRANGVVTAEQAALAEEFNDTMNRVKLTAIGVFRDVVMPLIPEAENLANEARQWAIENRGLIKTKVHEWLGKVKDVVLNRVIPALKDLYHWLVENWPEIKEFAASLLDIVKNLAEFAGVLLKVKDAILAAAAAALSWKVAVGGLKMGEVAAGLAEGGGAAAKAAPAFAKLGKFMKGAGLVGLALSIGLAIGKLIDAFIDAKSKTATELGNMAVKSQQGLGSASMSELGSRVKKLNQAEKDASGFWSYASDVFSFGQDSQDARDEIRRARAAVQGEQMRRLSGALQAGSQAPSLATPQVATSETRTTNTERTELVIRDETGRAEITRGGKKGTVKLVPTGAMP